jgi:hypothetical protein
MHNRDRRGNFVFCLRQAVDAVKARAGLRCATSKRFRAIGAMAGMFEKTTSR